jgi:hypothetical protein
MHHRRGRKTATVESSSQVTEPTERIRPWPTQRAFRDGFDEIEYLSMKAQYWTFVSPRPDRARAFAMRLRRVIARTDPDTEKLITATARAAIADAEGDIQSELRWRVCRVNMIRRLLASGLPARMRREWQRELLDDMELLALVYADAGQIGDAIRTCRACRRVASQFRLAFDSAALESKVRE